MESVRPGPSRGPAWHVSDAPLPFLVPARAAAAALVALPFVWLRSQAPLLVAAVVSLSVHGLPYMGLGSLARYFAAHAAAPRPPVEFEIALAPEPEAEREPPPEAEPEPPAVEPPPEPQRRKVREVKREPEPVQPPPEAPTPAPVDPSPPAGAAGPALAEADAEPSATACQTGVCLPVGQGGTGRVGSKGGGRGPGTGTGQGTGTGVARPVVFDKPALPIFRVQPKYPEIAAERDMEGWVLVRFSIAKDGSVAAPVVVKSEPTRIFDKAALDAIVKWKYRPMMHGGQVVVREGVTVKITFELE